MTGRVRSGVVALTAVVLAAALWFAVLARDPARVYGNLMIVCFPAVAVVILRHLPRNVVGWCFLVSGLLLSVNAFGAGGLVVGPPRGWASWFLHVCGWATAFAWFPGLFVLITVALLHFPDGLVSRRWLWLSVVAVVLMGVYAVLMSVVIWQVPVSQLLQNETPHLDGPMGVLLLVALGTFPLMLPVAVGVVASLVVRYRRASVIERLQIRWVLAAGLLAVLVELALDVAPSFGVHYGDSLQTVAEATAFGLIAVATGVAITRHSLYEIDRIVSRTVAYLVVSVLLVAVYGAVVAASALVVPRDYGSAGVAAATLAAVSLFVPLRRRVQHVVDRRFDRARYDADRTVDSFAAALRAEETLPGVNQELLAAVHRALSPAAASIWLTPAPARHDAAQGTSGG